MPRKQNISPYRRQPVARPTRAWAVAYEDIRHGERHIFPTRTFASYWKAWFFAHWFTLTNPLSAARIGKIEG